MPRATYVLLYDGKSVPLRATSAVYARREALRLIGARLEHHQDGQLPIELTLTEFALDGRLRLPPRRLQQLARLPRPVQVEYLGLLQLPLRLAEERVTVGGQQLPLLLYMAKVLTCDDGTRRHHQDWLEDRDLPRRILASPPQAMAAAHG